jgi:hypothetical protein
MRGIHTCAADYDALNPQNDERRTIILSLPATQLEIHVRNFWRDLGVKEIVRRSREFQQRFRRILPQLYRPDGYTQLCACRSGYPQVTSEDDQYHGEDIWQHVLHVSTLPAEGERDDDGSFLIHTLYYDFHVKLGYLYLCFWINDTRMLRGQILFDIHPPRQYECKHYVEDWFWQASVY